MTKLQRFKGSFPTKELPFKVYFNADCLAHDTGPDHPECPERLEAIIDGCLAIHDKDTISFEYPAAATIRALEILHPRRYLLRLEGACLRQRERFMSPDNPICSTSFDAILAAGGLALALGKHLAAGGAGFALTRPPGHHAGREKAEGFCFLNHIGLAVEKIRLENPDARILVADFDVHHGNGSSEIYCSDHNVFFFSIHGSPEYTYPGTGWEYERGNDTAEGFTLNIPVPLGTKGDIWLELFVTHLEKAAEISNPDYLLVSAGFDAHIDDPLGITAIEDRHYIKAISAITDLAGRYCSNRLGFVLEGGYSLGVLKRLVPDIILQLSNHYNADSKTKDNHRKESTI